MSEARWHIGVAVPARDEEELLPRCLRSILAACAHLGHTATVDIAVVADSSIDRTVEVARSLLGKIGWVGAIEAGAVGLARHAATEQLLRRWKGPRNRFWIANTDADCIVPNTWLQNQWELAQSGLEALAGTVSVDSFEEHEPEVASRFQASYFIAPDGAHPHVHGANIGFRADVYLRAGGWGGLATAEDHDLWGRLSHVGARKCSTSHLQVQTSGRRIGRAPNGFAAALAAHNESAA